VKKSLSIILLVLGLFFSGCAALPFSPWWLLIKNQPAPLNEATPDAPQPMQPMPTPTPLADKDTTGTV